MAKSRIKSKGVYNGSEGFVAQQNDDIDYGGDTDTQKIYDAMTKGGLIACEDYGKKGK